MTAVTNLPLELLHRRPDARQRSDAKIAELEESIARLGLINPLRVRCVGDGYEVIAGAHRLQACDLLGWHEVPCIVVMDDDITAEMAMIAENLHRAELSKLERDEQVARWIELSGQHAPVEDSKAAADGVFSQVATKPLSGRPEGGVNAAARDLGIAKDDAYRAVKVASLSDEAKTVAREIGLDDNRSALLDAAKHNTPEAQVKALQERKQGGVANRLEHKPEPTYDRLRSAILFLCDLKPEDYSRLCPPSKRAAMCQKLSHLEQVFEQVREAASA